MFREPLALLTFFPILAASISGAQAACTSYPYPLTNGTIANGSEVIANFNCALLNGGPGATNFGASGTYGTLKLNVAGTEGLPNNSGTAQNGHLRLGGGSNTNVLDMGTMNSGPYGAWLQVENEDNLSVTRPLAINPNGGNVGIGSANPTLGRLQIQGSGDQYIAINATGGGDQGLYLFDNGVQKWRLYNNPAGGEYFSIIDAPQTHGVALMQGNNSWSSASDARLKTDIKSLNVLDKIAGFRAVSFQWRSDRRLDIGVIAQELVSIFPEAVTKGSGGSLPSLKINQPGIWSVDYAKLAPIALEGVKELRERMDLLKTSNDQQSAEIRELRAQVEELRRTARVQTAKWEKSETGSKNIAAATAPPY